jgi:hypothetical protein
MKRIEDRIVKKEKRRIRATSEANAPRKRRVRFDTIQESSSSAAVRFGGSWTTGEAIADTHYRLNTFAALSQLLTKSADVYVQRARVAIVTVTPNII